MAKKDLVQIIRDNPSCVAIIDNDSWTLHKVHPYGPDAPPEDETDDWGKIDAWHKSNELASSDDDLIVPGDDGYGSGNCYGGDILQALAQIVGVKVESV